MPFIMVYKSISILMMSQLFDLSKKKEFFCKIWTVLLLIQIIRNFDNKFAGVGKVLSRFLNWMMHCIMCWKTCLIENNLFWCVNHPLLFALLLPLNWCTQAQHNQLSKSVTVWTTTAYGLWILFARKSSCELYMASSKPVSDSALRLTKGFD